MTKQTRLLFKTLAALGVAGFLSGCGVGGFENFPQQVVTNEAISKVPDQDTGFGANPALTFCSPLTFEGIAWNRGLSLTERRSLAIALSISGSFEGSSGWTNITNNFDGQGLSAGLLNQTLGTGSLQPLLADMEYNYTQDFASSYSSTHLQSIQSMLTVWKNGVNWKPKSLGLMLAEATDRDALASESNFNSDLQMKAVSSPQDLSVQWAVKNLYASSGAFLSSWKTEIQNMLKKPSYVSLQVEAARRYHIKALGYLQRIGIYDLRAYLLMFDIVVQNGSISETRFVQWEKQVKDQKLTTTVSKLKALVELRLLDSNPKWRADVRARKYALIDGTGVVHGKNLNLPASYCYKAADPIQ